MRRTAVFLAAAQLAALVAVAAYIGDNGWDDGAITLAFARSFAVRGVIALTPSSEVVEGFSSPGWFLINAVIAAVRSTYGFQILAAQVAAALCFCASTLLLLRTTALLGLDRFTSVCVLVAFAAWGAFFTESANGMEMGLLTASFLVLMNEVISVEPRPRVLAASVVVVLLVRFEAALYVLAVAGYLAGAGRRRDLARVLTTAALTLSAVGVFRWLAFHDLLPNTVHAKFRAPYSAGDLRSRLLSSSEGAWELPAFFAAPMLLTAAVMRAQLIIAWRERRLRLAAVMAPIGAAIFVGALVGQNWGYSGRMTVFAVPWPLLTIGLLLSGWRASGTASGRVAIAATFAIAVAASFHLAFPFGAIAAARAGGAFGVTVHSFARTGELVRRVASAAGLHRPVFLTPDVGGAALCCDELRIVDLAMLSNARLARGGYAALEQLLIDEHPDIIEAHWDWATRGRLYQLDAFRRAYLPLYFSGTKLWVERRVAARLEGAGACQKSLSDPALASAVSGHRYHADDLPEDRAAFADRGEVLVLDDDSSHWCASGASDAGH
jgi:hypothetical protein